MIENMIIIGIVLATVIPISVYLVKAKQKGHKCVGCPYARQCAAKKNGACANTNK